MPRTTGYALREAIKQWELRKDAASRVFDTTLMKFPGEEKPNPEELINKYFEAEMAIAQLQTAQSEYNLHVSFAFEDKFITLSEAVKSLGGYSRVEKLWRTASGGGKKESYYRNDNERDPTKQYATQVIAPMEGVEKATIAARRASALRAAIATGNAKELDVNFNPELLK
jgi:hypothetical protein